jgi:hypothetical protein
MTNLLNSTCPLCGLRFSSRPQLELHMRDDHLHLRSRKPQEPADDKEDPQDSARTGQSTGVTPVHARARIFSKNRSIIRDALPALLRRARRRRDPAREHHDVVRVDPGP